MTWLVLVKCVATAFSNYCARIPVEVVGEEVSDAFCLVHISISILVSLVRVPPVRCADLLTSAKNEKIIL